jgi:hypothetical protein
MTAREELQRELQQIGLDKFVTAQTVFLWFQLGQDQGRPLLAMTVLLGLASSNTQSQAHADRLLKSAQKLQAEWALEYDDDNFPNESKLKVYEVDSTRWAMQLRAANSALQLHKFDEATESYQGLFQLLLDDGGASTDIYKFYANFAMARIGAGDRYAAEWLLEKALTIKPDYVYGRNMQRGLDDGTYDDLLANGAEALAGEKPYKAPPDISKHLASSPAGNYYRFLQLLGINYAGQDIAELVEEPAHAYKGIGRNESCPCGARNDETGRPIKFKRCHGSWL